MAAAGDYHMAALIAQFDATRAGVRGLVESGVSSVPPFFEFFAPSSPSPTTNLIVPTVDLSLPRSATVPLVGAAARTRTCGFFHVTNHGVDAGAALSAVRAFHELPRAVHLTFYTVAPDGGVIYNTFPATRGHYASRPLCWRDYIRLFLPTADFARMPEVCRDGLLECRRRTEVFGKEMAGLLSEALGVGAERLEVAASC